MNDQIKIDNRGHNHPFAVLINHPPYHRVSSSTEDFHSFLPHYQNFPMYHHSIDMNAQKLSNYPNEYEYYKYDNNRQYATATNYYPWYPQFAQPWLKRDASASSFMSDTKFNFNKTGTSDSFYVPQAASLYGSVGGQGVYPAYLNISHVRNNTGSDLQHGNPLPLATNHKPGNLSHDFTLSQNKPTKMWLNPKQGPFYDDLIEINSSGFLSEEASMFETKSRSNSPNHHWRTISNLNDPGYSNEVPSYLTMPIKRISEERKSDEEASVSFQDMEELIGPILKDPSQQVKSTPTKLKPPTSKLIPTSSIFLPTSKRNEKDSEVFTQNIVSASKLKAKTDDIHK